MSLATFVKEFQVILTRRCAYACGYCSFGSTPSPLPPSRKQLARHLRAAGRLGARQVVLSAGEGIDSHPEIISSCRYYGYADWYEYLYACCEQVMSSPAGMVPVLDVGALPMPELRKLKPVAPIVRLLLHSADDRLTVKGPHARSPHKRFGVRLAALEAPGRLGMATVTGITVGMGESAESWVEAASAVSQLHRSYGHIACFVIRPFFPERFSPMEMCPPVGDEVLLSAIESVHGALESDIVLGVELTGRAHLVAAAVKAGAMDIGPYRIGYGGRVNIDVEEEIDSALEAAARHSIELRERMPFLDSYLKTRASREHMRGPVKELDRIGRIIMAPQSKAIA